MKYFIITGASQGLGEALAIELLDEGHHLLCISRSSSERLGKLAAAKNCQVDFFPFDLAHTNDIPNLVSLLFDKVNTELATGIYLVNNAGVIKPVDRIERCEADQVDLHMRINLLAPMMLCAGFVAHTRLLPVQKRIMHISSGAATNPYSGWSSYCTAKAGLDMFHRCLATEQEAEKHPVESMAVAPGIIDTNMQTTIRSTTEEQFVHRKRFVELKESGQLVPPAVAGKRLAQLLLSDGFENGKSIDIRDSY
jgi:benzil reductase ((S)-benzoin forming)